MYLIIKKIIAIILLCNTLIGYGQATIKGKIVDHDTGALLGFTQIININDSTLTSSKADGSFEILKEGLYSFKKEGYISKTIKLAKNRYYIIQLNINPSMLSEVVISANHIPKKLKKATTSIDIITSEDIELSNNTDFAPILNRTPGVFMQSGALNTNRITIRGIGSRNLFGTAKIRAYFKDIPLTNGSGETTIEDFELASISRFEIIKGAASSIYGAGLGGIIHITPETGLINQSDIKTEFSLGSFGLVKSIVNANYGSSKNSFRSVYSNTHSDGYRENNTYDRRTFTFNSSHYINEKDELTFLASYVNLKAFIPSSINETDYLNNPEKAAFTWEQAKGFEDAKRGIFGLSWNHQYHSNLKQVTSVFSSFRDAYEPRPFNILKENTFALGVRSRFLGNSKLFNKNLNWTLGAELFRDRYRYETFENLYGDFPSGSGSVEGNRLSDFKEKRNYYNVFIETNYEFSENTTLSLGINLNETGYKLNDRFTVSDENPDQSGRFKFKSIVSPKIGLSHLFSKNISLFSNVSHGFSPISLNETLLPDGQINTDLKPETGWNFEVGTRASLLRNKLQLNLAVFRLNIKNLLVSRRTAEDEFIGINAGKTRHDGLEVSLHYDWLKKDELSVSTFANYTLNNFIFKQFIDDTNNFSRNELTGVPSDVLNAGILIDSAFGVYGNINFQHVGSMPINDANTLYSDSYSLTHLKIGFKLNLNKRLKLNTFLGLNNIFNTQYASQILINATGFGGNAPRYYYPGNPLNYYTGLNINYIF